MKNNVSKDQEKQRQSASQQANAIQNKEQEQSFFQDNRPQSLAQRKRQNLADKSPLLQTQLQQQNSMDQPTGQQLSPLQLKAAELIAMTQSAVKGDTDWATTTAQWKKAGEVIQGKDWNIVQAMAMDTFNNRQAVLQQQKDGSVVQAGGWDIVQDVLSLGALVSSLISVIASRFGAVGVGWLIPALIPTLTTLASSLMAEFGATNDLKERKARILAIISAFLATVASIIVSNLGAQEDLSTAAGITAGVTAGVMLVLEVLRVNFISRDTIYTPLKNLIVAGYNKAQGYNQA